MSSEWYQSPAWDEDAEADFRRRLSRARDQKPYYLKAKAAAIADAFPDAAVALCDERMAIGDEDERSGAAYAKALIFASNSRSPEMVAALEEAIGEDGLAMGAPAAGEYCCIVGYFGLSDRYGRALRILDALDAEAMKQAGRPFRSFATRAARALIEYKSGRTAAAVEPAEEALKLALQRSTGIAVLDKAVATPDFPNPIHDALVVIAGKWDRKVLGPPPEV